MVDCQRSLDYTPQMQDAPRRPGRPTVPTERPWLLERARSAFAESGYAGTSLAHIAERTGLRKPSLLHHFGTKEALYVEAMEDLVRRLAQPVLEVAQRPGTFLERLDALTGAVVDALAAEPDAAALLVREVIDRGPYWRGPGQRPMLAALRMARIFLLEGLPEDVDVDAALRAILGLHVLGFATRELTSALEESDPYDARPLAHWRTQAIGMVRRLCGLAA